MGESDLGKVSKPRSLIILQIVKTVKSGRVVYSTSAVLSRSETWSLTSVFNRSLFVIYRLTASNRKKYEDCTSYAFSKNIRYEN